MRGGLIASLRPVVKTGAEHTLILSGAAYFRRRQMAGRVLVLAYHNVLPDGIEIVGDVANHLRLSTFVAQVASLSTTHEIIPLSEALSPSPRSTWPRAVITFDDAYRGAVRHAIPELVRRSIPATIFVAPAFLDGRSFWWDALATSAKGGLDPALREHALGQCHGDDAAVRAWAAASGYPISAVPDLHCAASEEEILYAATMRGISLGSHSWSHPNLTGLSPEALVAELTRPLAWLQQRVAAPVRWIAYPYGCVNEVVERAAENAGYEAALAVDGGWFARSPSDRYALPRTNIPPGLSLNGFILRASGLLSP